MVALTPSPDKNSQTQQVAVSQQQTIIGLQSQLQNIQSEVSVVNTGLQRIGTQIKNDSLLEQTRLLEEQKREKSLSEGRVRLGKESDVEQQINASLTKPIQGIESRLNQTFGSVTSSLGTLFTGFLTTGVIQNISKIANFGIKSLGNVKSFFGKSLGFVGTTIKSFKDGLSNITGTVGKIIKKIVDIASNLAKSPIKFIADLFKGIPGMFSGAGSAAGNVASAGGSILDDLLKIVGKTVSSGAGGAVAAGVDIATGERPDRAIAGGVGAAFGGALGGLSGSILGPVGTLAGGVTGSIAGQQGAKSLYDYSTTNFNSKVFSQDLSNNLNLNLNPGKFLDGITEGTKGFLSGTGISQMMNNEEKPETTSKAEMTLPVEPKIPAIQISSSATTTPAIDSSTPSAQISTPEKPSAQISAPPKQEIAVGALPEPSPNVIVASTLNQNRSNTQSVAQSRVATDVPLLSSANSDNFYSLYSQMHYNVVI